jgi:hypothetical protein
LWPIVVFSIFRRYLKGSEAVHQEKVSVPKNQRKAWTRYSDDTIVRMDCRLAVFRERGAGRII